jgi:hypothetical protein
MTDNESVHLLEKLSEHSDFQTGIFFTYGADLAFFEEAVLHPLWQRGCRSNLVFMDARRYADTVDDLRGSTSWVGRRYILLPVDLGVLRSFHPKMVLLLGRERGRLLVGSGNLTFTGFGHNHEVFTCLDWTPEEPDSQQIFCRAWELTKAILERWGYSGEARTFLRKTERVSDWLLRSSQPPAGIRLLHTLQTPLIEQCSELLAGEPILRLTVLSPFLDGAAKALGELHARFQPQELLLILQDQRTAGNVQALRELQQAGVPLRVRRFTDDERYLHAKIYVFEGEQACYLLTGSANCTRAAWLATGDSGNIELMLLRLGLDRQHAGSLLKERIGLQEAGSLEELGIQLGELPASEHEASLVRLLDVSVERGSCSVVFEQSAPLGANSDLQLRFFTSPLHHISLGVLGIGPHEIQVRVPPDLLELLIHPTPASIWGTSQDGVPVDLGCNNLWITNVDALRYEISRYIGADVRAGRYLHDQALGSEEEWRELYESLVRLVELDVAGLRRRGGTYTASPPTLKAQSQTEAMEREVEVRLVDPSQEIDEEAEISAALYRESPLYVWLEYVHGRLPGASPEPVDPDREAGKPSPSTMSGGQHKARQQPPPKRMGQRFVNLVYKYIRSLNNPEYMQAASLYHILAYYPVFLRIVWLLLQHEVISVDTFVRLTCEINQGFLGSTGDGPPVTCPSVARHVQRLWLENWRQAEVHSYALASVIATENLIPELTDIDLKSLLIGQNLRTVTVAVSVAGVPLEGEDLDLLARTAVVYAEDTESFIQRIAHRINDQLPEIEVVLDDWIQRITVSLGHTKDLSRKRMLYLTMSDYGRARCDALALLNRIEEQTQLCSDLAFWMFCADDAAAASEWSEMLIDLLQKQGKSQQAVRAMVRQGRDLFHDRQYEAAASCLRQALLLAERLGDTKSSSQCESYIRAAEMFL